MQTPVSIPHSLRDLLWLLLASFFTLGGGAGFWSWIQNRKKNRADVHESQARSRHLDVQSTVLAGDTVLRYMDRLSHAEAANMELRRELEDERERAAEAEQLRAANALLERQLQETQIQVKFWEGEARKRG